ncbi:acyltransferase family protein [Micromonospora sp. WMMD1102]|uniref:acyltransferase family protein n=1 Tax=Micromonospora sp. WMMD1102 TaxID=3016105 RepID=UPI0024151D1A|nr:acyltransferase family protein [Micromonospora sp. WMMD1102]MDG4790422.1 acyltransferase family protein [Micromonospora sp. WMMD1102]
MRTSAEPSMAAAVPASAEPVSHDTPAPPGGPPGGRDRWLDLWRAAALVRVVTYHVLGWIWLTVLFPAMGLMFALAGSLMAGSLDRTGGKAVGRRLRRLLPPLWGFGAVAVTLLLVTGWRTAPGAALGWGELAWWIFPARTPPVGDQPWAWAWNVVLWYIVTYLWLVLLSPVLLAAFRRWPWYSLAVAVALPIAFRFDVVNIGGYFNEQALNVSTYLACWMLGFAHHDGLLRRIPARRYALGVGLLAVTGAGWVLAVGWSTGNYDLNRIAGGNTLWSMAFVAAVLRFRPRLDWLARLRLLDRLVALLNARAVTIYLWHLPLAVVAGALIAPLAVSGWVQTVTVRLAAVWLLVAVAVALFGWIEDLAARRRPALLPAGVGRSRRRPATAAPSGRGAAAGVPAAVAGPAPAGPPPPAATRTALPAVAPPAVTRTAPAVAARTAPAGSVRRWHRAMAATVAVLAVGLGVMALNLWPGVTTRSQAQPAPPEVTYHLSDLPMLVDGDSERPSPAPATGSAPGSVTVQGQVYPRAVLTAAPGRVRVQPPAGCERLQAVIDVGADDVEVAFAVRADDVTVFESGVRSRADTAEQIDVVIAQASVVDLVTSSSSGGAVGVWADPRFVCAS